MSSHCLNTQLSVVDFQFHVKCSMLNVALRPMPYALSSMLSGNINLRQKKGENETDVITREEDAGTYGSASGT